MIMQMLNIHPDTSLSNKFDNTYNTQNTGITYRMATEII